MKKFATLLCVLLILAVSRNAQLRPTRQEITKDGIKTLLTAKSEQLSIMGFHLSMTMRGANAFLRRSAKLIGERDDYNSGRLYVYEKTPTGGKGKAVLYLIWDGGVTMRQITVFEDFQPCLNADFKKLFTAEALDQTSQFTKDFIGAPDRSAITLDIKSTGYQHITYYFDKIGLELTRKIDDGRDVGMVFALIRSKSASKVN